MKPLRQRKLMYLMLCLAGLTLVCTLVLYALRQNINLFYSPADLAQNQGILPTQLIRLGGMVVKNSVQRSTKNLQVSFQLTDYKKTLPVHYNGVLPTLFREGQGIVAKGYLLDDGSFKAVEVLAKHDENYMPMEVKRALREGEAGGR